MQVLVVIKKTNRNILHDKLVELKIKNHGFLKKLEESHQQQSRALDALRQVLKNAGCVFQEVTRDDDWPNLDGFGLIVTLGGDGTILSSSRFLDNRNIPVIGIRSSDESVGYLCCLDHSEVESKLPELLKNYPQQTTRLERLSAEVTRQKDKTVILSQPVLNDFLYTHKSPSCTTRYALSINGKTEEHKSSGIWFATPTGSTAAIGAAGGLKQQRDETVFQYKVRELYSPRPGLYKLGGGLYNPDKDRLIIINHNTEAILAVDGQHGTIPLELGDRITFKRAIPFKLVTK